MNARGPQTHHDISVISRIQADLAEMKKDEALTRRQIVVMLADDIKKRLKEGYKVEDVLKVLRARDIELRASTLRKYLCEAGKKSLDKKATQATQNAAREATRAKILESSAVKQVPEPGGRGFGQPPAPASIQEETEEEKNRRERIDRLDDEDMKAYWKHRNKTETQG